MCSEEETALLRAEVERLRGLLARRQRARGEADRVASGAEWDIRRGPPLDTHVRPRLYVVKGGG
jgi:hypothetical protein